MLKRPNPRLTILFLLTDMFPSNEALGAIAFFFPRPKASSRLPARVPNSAFTRIWLHLMTLVKSIRGRSSRACSLGYLRKENLPEASALKKVDKLGVAMADHAAGDNPA